MGLRGSVFGILGELEFAAVEFSSLQRKNEERSKQPIENLSESSQKSEKSCSG
jgi:predicted HicB family RNase H-like nuclease